MTNDGRHFPPDKTYTKVPNYLLRDDKLRLGAKGLACVIQALPPTWDFTVSGLAKICNCGEDAIRSALKQLEDRGYLTRTQVRGEHGWFCGYQFHFARPSSDNPTSDTATQLTTDRTASESATRLRNQRHTDRPDTPPLKKFFKEKGVKDV